MVRAYLDHNATTPLRPAAREVMLTTLSSCGNASSIHAEGRAARALIEAARRETDGSAIAVAAVLLAVSLGYSPAEALPA